MAVRDVMGNGFNHYFGIHAHIATDIATNITTGFKVWLLFLDSNLEAIYCTCRANMNM